MISGIGKALLVAGLGLAALGLLLILADRFDVLRTLWERLPLGRLPGDVNLRRDGFSFSFPWVTCLVLSLVASLLFSLFRK